MLKETILSAGLVALILIARQEPGLESMRRQLVQNHSQEYCGKSETLTLTDKQKKNYESVQKSKKKKIKENQFGNFLATSDNGKMVNAYIGLVIPIIVFLVFSILGYITYFCCCCCDKCCPPCKCCRRDYEKKPLKRIEMLIPLGLMVILSVVLFGLAIAGQVKIGGLPKSLDNIRCAILKVPQNLLGGVVTDVKSKQEWIGLEGLSNNLSVVQKNLKDDFTQITSKMSNTAWTTTDADAIKTKIKQIPTTYMSKQVSSPGNGNKQDMVYMTLTGPIDKDTSLSYRLNLYALGVAEATGLAIKGIDDGLQSVNSTIDAVVASIQSGVTSINDISKTLTDQHNSLNDLSKGHIETFKGMIKTGTSAFLALLIIIAIANVAIGIIMVLCKLKFLRILLHVIWIFSCFVLIICFILTLVITPVSVMFIEVCEVLNNVLASETALKTYKLESKAVVDKIKVCLWNNSGNIAKSFGLEDKLNSINMVTDNFDKLFEQMQPSSGQSTTQKVNDLMNLEKNVIQEYQNGVKARIELDFASSDNNNPWIAVQQLTLKTDYSVNNNQQSSAGCNLVRDQFVYKSSDCTYSDIYTSSKAANYNVGNQVCIPVSEMTTVNLATRYTAFCADASCASLCGDAKTAFGYIKTYDGERNTEYGNLYSDVNTIGTDLAAYLTKAQNQVNSLTSVKTMVNNLMNSMKIIMARLNCKFIYNDLKSFSDALCIAFVPALYDLGSLVFDCAMVLFFANFMVYLTALKFSHFKDMKNMKGGAYNHPNNKTANKYVENVEDENIRFQQESIQMPGQNQYNTQDAKFN